MPTVEIKQLVGEFRESRTGRLLRAGHPIDRVFLDGRQIATINRVPGVPIALLANVILKPAERAAVSDAIAAVRGGVHPAAINSPITLPFDILDDEEDDVEEDDE